MSFILWLLGRLREPSTYAGLSGLALAFGLSGEMYQAVAAALAGVAGLVAVILSERSKPEQPTE
ncbi:MAG: hypothetical protein ACK4WM_11045 [Thermoflexales bacterium]